MQHRTLKPVALAIDFTDRRVLEFGVIFLACRVLPVRRFVRRVREVLLQRPDRRLLPAFAAEFCGCRRLILRHRK